MSDTVFNASLTANSTRNHTVFAYYPPPPNVHVAGWILTPICICSFVANLLLIIIYFRNSNLRTPFGIYILCLSWSDLIPTVTLCTNAIMNFLQVKWPFGRYYCSFISYLGYALIGFNLNIHVLISMNRLWAVAYPNHYRLYHNRRTAISIIFCLFVYVNVLTVPGIVIHGLYYNQEDGKYAACVPSYPHERIWSNTLSVVLYLLPEMMIIVVYPIVYWKVRNRANRVGAEGKNVPAVRYPNSAVGSLRRDGVSGETSQNVGGRSVVSGLMENSTVATSTVVVPSKKSAPSNVNRHFAILTALVCGAILCWTPINIAYVLMIGNWYFNMRLLAGCTVVFYLNSLWNPLLYPLTSQDWRRACKLFFHL